MTTIHRLLSLAVLATGLAAQPFHDVNVPCCAFVDSVSATDLTTVTVGTTVRWILQGNTPHTITSGTAPSGPGTGVLFNMSLNQTNPVRTYTFTAAGTYPYLCVPHFNNGMTGTVVVTVPSTATAVGAGCTGSLGNVLTLGAAGLPSVGNASFALAVSGGLPNGSVLLFGGIGSSTPGLAVTPSCNLYLEINSFLFFVQIGLCPLGPFPLSPSGTASIPFPVPNLPSWLGSQLDLQVGSVDVAVPGGFTVSNALRLRFGN